MRSRELAELLLHKAGQDEFVLEKLVSDPASPDEVIGFHAQQAIEKMLKAVLALHAVRYGRVHNLGVLLDLLRDHHIPFPAEFEEVRRLTPFGADFRYEDAAPGQAVHPSWAVDAVRRVRAWAEASVRSS
jgi:HEPN domain-containing protein